MRRRTVRRCGPRCDDSALAGAFVVVDVPGGPTVVATHAIDQKGATMYARVTRFEGSNLAALKQELVEMRDQRGLTDEAIDQIATW